MGFHHQRLGFQCYFCRMMGKDVRILFRAVLLLFSFYCNNGASSQTAKQVGFPKSFTGHWKGTLMWSSNGRPQQQTEMQLIIRSADTPGHYTWQIIYGKDEKDNRPYLLKPADKSGTHWVVDERNGILLDGFWIGNRFTGAFAVGGNTILDAYWIENNKLHAEFFSYRQQALNTTGKGTEESPLVESYRMNSYQKAVLSKMQHINPKMQDKK
jgi:hypothetical protein